MKKQILIFATHNDNKAKEIQGLLPDFIEVKTLHDLKNYENIPEEEPTLEGNALAKAKWVYDRFHVNCFADDTGLEIEVFNGAPGVHSARYAGEEKNSDNNMNLVLANLQGKENRKAQFRTVIALLLNGEQWVFEGKVEGEIRNEKTGNSGFGYDPIFEPENKGKTFAEMSLEEKNQCSHRSRAIEELSKFLTVYFKTSTQL